MADMKVFVVRWYQATKGGPCGYVVAEDEDTAFKILVNHMGGEIKHTKEDKSVSNYVAGTKYVWVKSSSMAYFIEEGIGWVLL